MNAADSVRSDAEAVLIVGPSWVGDMVMAQSLFKALRTNAPDAPIDVLAPGWSLPLLARMPEVRQGVQMALGHGRLALTERWRLGRSLRGRYSRAILLPNSWKSAIVPYAAGIPRRTGWLGEMRYGLLNDIRRLDRQRFPMTVQRFVALAGAADAPLPAIQPPRLQVRDLSNTVYIFCLWCIARVGTKAGMVETGEIQMNLPLKALFFRAHLFSGLSTKATHRHRCYSWRKPSKTLTVKSQSHA